MRLRTCAASLVLASCLATPPAFAQAQTQTQIVPGPVTPADPTALPLTQGWSAEPIVNGLEHPWAVAWLPNGDMLITERPGRLRIVRDGKLDPKPIAGLPPILALRQGGLLDVAPHPDFTKNKLIFLTYAAGTEEANSTRVLRAKLDRGRLSEVKEIFRASPDKAAGFHFGSRLLWLPDGTLLVTLGDGGRHRDRAQDLGAHFGKIVRMTIDGAAPADNPFNARTDALPHVWSYGHRNVQGIARDPATGRIFATEHGAQGGDELNLVRAGADFGWPSATYAVEYGQERKPISPRQSAPGMDDPLAVWTPSIAPSGLAFYTGALFPEWRGDIFAGALLTGARTNPGGIIRVRINADGKAIGMERIALNARIRDVRQGPDGALYALTDEAQGQLLRISPGTARRP